MKVEIFSIMKNEEAMLPFYLKHYQDRFKDCIINVYDNGSTDNSIQICKDAGCYVGQFPVYTEELLKDWKNTIWKDSTADWIIVCDIDELLHITDFGLESLPEHVNIISTKGYTMIDVTNDNLPIEKLDHGVYAPPYCKNIMFKNNYISDMNYEMGAHQCNPVPTPVYSTDVYALLHYNKHSFTLEAFHKKFQVAKEILNEDQLKVVNESLNVLFESSRILAVKLL